jgi:hypothetical protein
MRPLPTYALVRVRQLVRPPEEYDGWKVNKRPPQVGDVGTIVDVLTAPGLQEEDYVVECSGPDGVDLWLGDFSFDELELLPNQQPAQTNRQRPPRP